MNIINYWLEMEKISVFRWFYFNIKLFIYKLCSYVGYVKIKVFEELSYLVKNKFVWYVYVRVFII